MITFTRPVLFILLFFIPAYWFFKKIGILKKLEIPLTLANWDGQVFIWTHSLQRFLQGFASFCFVIGFILAVVGAAGPTGFVQEKIYTGAGSGILFVLDVSPSMAASDFPGGTRLDISKQNIRSFMSKRPGDSFGLVAFGTEASLLVPPTIDHLAFLNRLDLLSLGEFGDGTAIGMGLAVAVAHIRNQDYSEKAIVLLTDGDNNAGEISPKTAARLCATEGISLFIAGIGTKGDVAVDYIDPVTGTRFTGILESDFNESALKEIAEIAGGSYIHAHDFKTIEYVFSLAEETLPIHTTGWIRTKMIGYENIFVLAAMCFFLAHWFITRLFLRALL